MQHSLDLINRSKINYFQIFKLLGEIDTFYMGIKIQEHYRE